MRLFFKERPFSWDLDYDIFYENETKAYHVKNEQIKKRLWNVTLYNRNDMEIGKIERKESLFGGEKYTIYFDDREIGSIEKTYVHNKTRYLLKMVNWRIFGLIPSWEYDILDDDAIVAHAGVEGSPYEGKGNFMLEIYYENSESMIVLACLGMEAANAKLAEKEKKRLEKKLHGK